MWTRCCLDQSVSSDLTKSPYAMHLWILGSQSRRKTWRRFTRAQTGRLVPSSASTEAAWLNLTTPTVGHKKTMTLLLWVLFGREFSCWLWCIVALTFTKACWLFLASTRTDGFTLQAISMRTKSMDTLSQFSVESTTSADSKDPVYIAAGDIRKRLSESLAAPKTSFQVRRRFLMVVDLQRNNGSKILFHNLGKWTKSTHVRLKSLE